MNVATRKQKIEGPMLYRAAAAGAEIIDADKRIVRLSFSSDDVKVLRSSWWDDPWLEVLGHEPGEINMVRLDTGSAPALLGHDTYSRDSHVGKVVKAWVKDGRAYADVQISKRVECDGVWQDIVDGILSNVSVGYSVDERTLVLQTEGAPNEYRVTKWTPMEISFVPIAADFTVGVGRSADTQQQHYRVTDLPTNITEERAMDPVTVIPTAPVVTAPDDTAVRAAAAAATTAERQRTADISTMCRKLDLPQTVADGLIERGLSLVDAQREAIDSLHAKRVKDGAEVEMQRGNAGETREIASEREKVRGGMLQSLLFRAGHAETIKNPDATRNNEYRGFNLRELARECLTRAGVRTNGMGLSEMIGRAFTHSTSDFPYLLENSARKFMLMGWTTANETYQIWTRPAPMADFKAHSFVNLSNMTGLLEVKENAEYKHLQQSDTREQATLVTYGGLFGISRQAIINDDLNAFTRTPQLMGLAAARKVGDLAYGVLTLNAAMADTVALFHADHANLIAPGSGAAPSVTTLGTGRTAMRRQTDPKSVTLNIQPKYLLVPVALEDNSRVLASAIYDPDTANKLQKPNPVKEYNLTVVSDPRLDTYDAAAWYLAADQNQCDTVIIGHLDDEPNPVMEQKDGWNVDGIEFKVRKDAVAKAVDYRGLFKNDGN